jgi:hypothetical protein
MTPDEAELLAFAAEREPEEADDAEFELEDEAEFVESTAQHFLTDGEGFKKLWRTSPPGQKQLIHSLMAVDHELQRLSGIGYLLEAIDLPRHRYGLEAIFSAWANGRSDKPFFEYLNAQPPMEERPIKYYNEAEREAYRLEPGPAMMRTTGDVLDGDNIFVMSGNNQIYAGAKSRGDVNVHHSSFLAGEAVASAGHLFANNGDLWKINLASGHYTPGRPQLARVLVVLQEWGVDLTQVQAVAGEHDAEEKINAEDWLARYLSTLAEGEGEKEAGDF